MLNNPIIDKSGDKRWYNKKGQLHRLDGPAAVYTSGHKEWWVNGKLHRLNGPAIEFADESKLWFIDDLRHRLDGPAVEYANGYKTWWINDIEYTEKEYWNKISELQIEVAAKPKISRFKKLEIR